jgi:hypothetical protein
VKKSKTIKDIIPDDRERLELWDSKDKQRAIEENRKSLSKLITVQKTYTEEEYNKLKEKGKNTISLDEIKVPFTMISGIPSQEFPNQPKDLLRVLLFELTPGLAKTFYNLVINRNKYLEVELPIKDMDKQERQYLSNQLYKLKKAGLIKHVRRGVIMLSPNHLVTFDPAVHYKWDQLK